MDNVRLANALFDAIEANDREKFLSLCSLDARVIDTSANSNRTIVEEADFLATLPGLFKTFKYAHRRYVATADGAVLQHSLQGETRSGHSMDAPIMIRLYAAHGKVSRLEQYYDSTQMVAVVGDSPLRQFLHDMKKASFKNPQAYDEFVSPGLTSGNLTPMYTNRDGFFELGKILGKAFSGYTQEDTHYVEQGNLIVRRVISSQTHIGQFMGIPATGKKATFEGFEMFEIVDGKIVSGWILPDTFSMLQQFGAMPDTMKLGPAFMADRPAPAVGPIAGG